MKISPARKAAFEVLMRIEKDKAFSSVLLPQYEERLEPKDRGLCHELVLGVLRKTALLDKELAVFSKGKSLDKEVLTALRLGLYQIRYLDRVPDHSAVNESVELVIAAKKRSAKGFVNAILRRATRETAEFNYSNELEQIATETNLPEWLLNKWTKDHGKEKAYSLAKASREQPRTAFRAVRSRSIEFKDLINERPDLKPSEIANGAYISERSSSDIIKAANDGTIYFQDEASQLAAVITADLARAGLMDVCAAPGSKTTLMGDILRDKNVKITAGDKYKSRLRSLEQSIAVHSLENITTVEYDAEESLPFEINSFDTILVDAPCSGTGTIRHNPELPQFLDPADINELTVKQLKILQNASKLLSVGGKLVYSTCSVEPEENEEVCERFLATSNDFRQFVPNVAADLLTKDGHIRAFPDKHDCDGFFIAIFEKC